MLNNQTIAVVIPAYNEERQIGQVIETMPDFVDYIFVIDDGSSDKTVEIARKHGAKTVLHKKNQGVGAAFNTGVMTVLKKDVDIMVNIDADGQFNPEDIEKLVMPIIEKKAEFVTASRFSNKAYYPKMSRIKFLGNKFMSGFISKLTRQKFYDVSCGFRAYSKETLQRLNLFADFTYTQETFIDLAFKKITILEVPIEVRGIREQGKSKVASNLFRYGFQTLKIIIRTFRDYKPFRLFGYLSLFTFIIGLAFAIFLGIHYINTGAFTPHKWAGFTAGFFWVVTLFFLLIGFIMDMFARMRQNQEEILFELKKSNAND